MIGFNCSRDLYTSDGPYGGPQCPPAQTLCLKCERTASPCVCSAMASASHSQTAGGAPKYGHRMIPIPDKDSTKGTPHQAPDTGPLSSKACVTPRGKDKEKKAPETKIVFKRADSARPQKLDWNERRKQRDLFKATRRMDTPREEIMRMVLDMTTKPSEIKAQQKRESPKPTPAEPVSVGEMREQPLTSEAAGSTGEKALDNESGFEGSSPGSSPNKCRRAQRLGRIS